MYCIMKVINIINDKFLVLIILNVLIFYALIENYSDHFLFKAKMTVVQVVEGVIGLVECLIPEYKETKKENK